MNQRQNYPDPPGGTILLTTSGSELYGTSLGDADRDEFGVYVENPAHVTGLLTQDTIVQRSQPAGVRSGPGDLDRQVHGVRKFARLAGAGNPTVLLLLFVPPEHRIIETPEGALLLENAGLFISKQAGYRFLGYLDSQRAQMVRLSGTKHTNRPELIEKHGYDTKFAYHALRLGIQGIELMRDGVITLPMPDEDRQTMLDVRRGLHSKDEVIRWIDYLRSDLVGAIEESGLPDEPNWAGINDLCHVIYLNQWATRGSM